MKNLLILLTIIIVLIIGWLIKSHLLSQNNVVSKICKYVNMPPVKITIYTNKDGLVGGYFARTTRPSVTDAPSFLFDAKGENVIRDSFFSTPQEREAFKASMETMLKKFTIQKDILCSN